MIGDDREWESNEEESCQSAERLFGVAFAWHILVWLLSGCLSAGSKCPCLRYYVFLFFSINLMNLSKLKYLKGSYDIQYEYVLVPGIDTCVPYHSIFKEADWKLRKTIHFNT